MKKIKNCVVKKHKTHDYTPEIIRCSKFIISQYRRGFKIKDVVLQAQQSYGYSITLNAQRALFKNLTQ